MDWKTTILCLGPYPNAINDVALAFAESLAPNESRAALADHVRQISSEVLEHLRTSQLDPTFTDLESTKTTPWNGVADQLVQAIDGPKFFADTRLSYLSAFWEDTLLRNGVDEANIRYLVLIQDPFEFAADLRFHYRFRDAAAIRPDLNFGVALWLSHLRNSLRNCLGKPTLILSGMDRTNWSVNIGNFLGISDLEVKIAASQTSFGSSYVKLTPNELALLNSRYSTVKEIYDLVASAKSNEAALQVLDKGEVQKTIEEAILLSFPAFLSNQSQLSQRLKSQVETQNSLVAEANLFRKDLDENDGRVRTQFAQIEKELRNQIASLDDDKSSLLKQLDEFSETDTKIIKPLRTELDNARMANVQQKKTVDRLRTELEKLHNAHSETVDAFDKEREQAAVEFKHQLDERTGWVDHWQEQYNLAQSNANEQTARLQLAEQRHNTEVSVLRSEKDVIEQALYKTRNRFVVRMADRVTSILNFRQHLKRSWAKFHRLTRICYHFTLSYNPGLARIARRVLEPIVRFGNKSFFGTTYVPLTAQTGTAIHYQDFQFDYQKPGVSGRSNPLVSIIVPNYNHAEYLDQRLRSIYNQTYKNFEVILLDDNSSDASRGVLSRYQSIYPENTRTLFNKENSGSVFFQWQKGIAEAKGALVWIAESDDWASENFLETLVPFFENSAVSMAYCWTNFMSGSGDEQIWSLGEYLSEIDPEKWKSSFVETAAQSFRYDFSLKNIIPNGSSAIFRKPSDITEFMPADWPKMKTCGDWYFYLNLLKGGLLAYSPDASNFYRIHNQNTSVKSYADKKFYEEHQTIACTLQENYRVDETIWQMQIDRLKAQWRQNSKNYKSDDLEKVYSLAKIKRAARSRKPNILMASFGFCAGGGETFPIQLANLLRNEGFSVTFLDCAQDEEIPEIRAALSPEIPVLTNLSDLNQIVDDFDIDIIHSHHAWVDNTILDILDPNSPAKTVVSLHGMYETIDQASLKTILPRLVERTGQLIYTAEKNLTALTESGLITKNDIPRIDNALPKHDVTPVSRDDFNIPNDAFVLANVSRAFDFKGWEEAIAATTLARKKCDKDIHLVLIGEGPVYEKLRREGTPDFVHLLGFQSDVRGFFAMSEMGLLSTRFKGESFPLVLIDCLLAGRPVLATDAGEIEYMLSSDKGKAGIIVPLENWEIPIEELADAMVAAATDTRLYQSVSDSVDAARIKFDPSLMVKKYSSIYEELAEEVP